MQVATTSRAFIFAFTTRFVTFSIEMTSVFAFFRNVLSATSNFDWFPGKCVIDIFFPRDFLRSDFEIPGKLLKLHAGHQHIHLAIRLEQMKLHRECGGGDIS